jgi:ABC-2 type transport system ATP-binding protein
MSAIISVNHLSKHYKDLTAVNDISFTVHQGDVYGFLGQNGAGKSTTIRMLLSLIEPSQGSIELFGMDLKKHRRDILRQVGAVIERPDLYKYLTAYENLSLFARMSGIKAGKQQLMDQLELVGLADRAHSKVKTFSQGMKQRLGIGVALVHDPQLIILDEPTNGLDPQGIADIRQLILNLSHQFGKTVLVSSHLLYEIEMTANRMIIIDKGKKVAEGNVKELFDTSNMLIRVGIGNLPTVLPRLQASRWQAQLQTHEEDHVIFRMDEQQVPALTADLVGMGAAITAVQPQHSLEAYFLALTTANRHVDPFTN